MGGKRWTIEEDAYLMENYENAISDDLVRVLNRSLNSIYYRASVLGLKKSEELIKEIGRLAVLKNPEPYRRTWIKKGTKPKNTLYDGAITVRLDTRTNRQCQFIRISTRKWEELHRYVWEQAHGPIPKGKIIAFKNGNTMDCSLDNLEMITREENMSRNALDNYPKPIADVIRLTGVINRLTKNRLKNA